MKLDRRSFRVLLVASLILGIAAAVTDSIFPHLLPSEIRDAQALLVEAAAMQPPLGVAFSMLILFIVGVVGFVGLYCFRSWARPLNLLLCMSVFVYGPLMGHFTISGWGLAFFEMSLLTWGGMTALSYAVPLDAEFKA